MSTKYLDERGNVFLFNFKKVGFTGNKQETEINERPISHLMEEPYFAHIAYKDDDLLYIGKQEIPGRVVDWADKRASYYYQYDIYIGNSDVDLRIVREIYIKNRAYAGYVDLYNRTLKSESANYDDTDNEVVPTITDERLIKVIAASRNDKHIHDIIASIQTNQYNIIIEDISKNMLVHGCAGSGKTMVMLHRVRYLKYNNPKLDMGNFIIISPTDILGRENEELSNILNIDRINQFSSRTFYEYITKLYLTEKKIAFTDYTVEDGTINARDYSKDEVNKNLKLILEMLDYNSERGKQFLDKEMIETKAELDAHKKTVVDAGKDFELIYNAYLESIEELNDVSKEDIEIVCDFLSKEIEKELALQREKYILEMLIESGCIRKKNTGSSLINVIQFIKMLDIRGINQSKYEIHNSIEAVQLFSLFYNGNASDKQLYDILDEINNVSTEYINGRIKYIQNQLDVLGKYKDYIDYLSNVLLQDGIIKPEGEKRVLENGKELVFLEKTLNFYLLISEIKEIKNQPYSYCNVYTLINNRYKRIENQINKVEEYTYLFDAFCKIVDSEKKNGKYILSTGQAFILSNILYVLFGSIKSNQKYIYVDEFQDYSADELGFIKKVFEDSILSLYGDVNQCISEKGTTSLSYVTSLCDNNVYTLNVNYRNSREVAEYVRDEFDINMVPVGLPGSINSNLDKVVYDDTDRIVAIFSNNDLLAEKAHEYLGPNISLYSESGIIKPGIINAITIDMVKGLEFEKVVVFNEGLSRNERYVAYTRALEDLYIIE